MAKTAPFLGIYYPGDHEANEKVGDYRSAVLQLDPNGTAPLTAMSSKASRYRPLTDSEFRYFTNTLPEQGGAFTALYNDAALSSAYAGSGVSGQTVYIKMGATRSEHVACVTEFRPDYIVALAYSEDPDVTVLARVASTHVNGANSYLAVILLEADDNSSNGFDLRNADYVYVVQDAHQAGGYTPESVNYPRTSVVQHTEIFKEALELTRTAMNEELKTFKTKEELLKHERALKLLLHYSHIEKALFFSKYGYYTNANGKEVWTMRGLIEFIRTFSPGNINDFRYNANYAGEDWAVKGGDWFREQLLKSFKYKPRDFMVGDSRIAFTSQSGLLAINQIVQAETMSELTMSQKMYGWNVYDWLTPAGGMLHIMTHPWFNYMPFMEYTMIVTHPKLVAYSPLRGGDTKLSDVTAVGFDGIMEQYLTECTFHFYHSPIHMVLSGLGKANVV